MIDLWLLWATSIVSMAALVAVIRLHWLAHRHEREVRERLALLARAVESIRGKASLLGAGLTPEEVRAVENLKRRQAMRPGRRSSSPVRPDHDPLTKG